ncbi:hypothetical protein N0791_27210, partial [Pseudomonas aeruginosa]|nr:hypothetical protein [Pseudomonas aeruginosa]
VFIGEDGRPRAVLQVNADGSPATAFERHRDVEDERADQSPVTPGR